MALLNDRHIAIIEKQDDHSLHNAFLQLCEEEVKHEEKLQIIRALKTRILIEIELRPKR